MDLLDHIKNYLRQRERAQLEEELRRVRELRMFMTQKEFTLLGKLDTLKEVPGA